MAKSKVTDLSVLEALLKDNVLGLSLIEKAKFMEKTLAQLQDKITEGRSCNENVPRCVRY